MSVVQLEPLDVMCVRVGGDVTCPGEAFRALESRLPSLRRRRFYGSWLAGEYRACVVRQEGDEPAALGLDTATLPGGAYVRRRLEGGYDRIGPSFEQMAQEFPHDATRPSLEHYRREDDVMRLLPVVA